MRLHFVNVQAEKEIPMMDIYPPHPSLLPASGTEVPEGEGGEIWNFGTVRLSFLRAPE